MGVKLPVPLAPFQELDIQGGSITIDVNAKQIVIPTDNQYLLPSFNQWTLNPNRCNLKETPCGGLKNSIVQDSFPGSLTIEGDGCYLQNLAGTYTGKSIGAGKLSETSAIVNTGDTGLEIATADGVILRMGDGLPFLLKPPSAIVEEFVITNISNAVKTYTLTIIYPNLISSIELYNITNRTKESVSFVKITNGYTFSKTISPNYSESFQITAIYTNLELIQSFTNDADPNTGLQNMSESWIALIPVDGSEINIFRFSDCPKQLEFKQNENGIITEVTLYPGNGSIYHSCVTHTEISRISGTGYIPDSLNIDFAGSISKFMRSYGMDTRFPPNTTLTTWVVPAISDTKILPLSEISDDFLGDEINLRMCPGEYGCASFVIQSQKDVMINIEMSDLYNNQYIVPNSNIDTRIVKRWYQGGANCQYHGDYTLSAMYTGKFYTPELLLHDDAFIWSDPYEWDDYETPCINGKNYIKLTNNTYVDISSESQVPTPQNINDADILQPFHLKKNINTQIWLTPHIPQGTSPGLYRGNILIKTYNNVLKQISINIIVLPFSLEASNIDTCVYYRAKLNSTQAVSTLKKTIEQYTFDVENMIAHGVTNTTIYPQDSISDINTILQIRAQKGMNNSTLFYSAVHMYSSIADMEQIKTISENYGANTIYVYGYDEQNLNTVERRSMIDSVHAIGLKIFCAEYIHEYITNIADLLDMVVAAVPSKEYSDLYHSYSSTDGIPHKVFLYSYPQSAPECPLTFRRNYGLLLWQVNYDGAIDFAYQFEASNMDTGNAYNDFDNRFRDHNFTYPTETKPIDTIQWEGYREAANDLKYLATLQTRINDANNRGVVTTDIDLWLSTLKNTDLSTVDLDDVRGQMIDYILQLQDIENYRSVLIADGDAICFGNGHQLFVRE